MRIFYDDLIFSNQHYGGISRYFVELAKNINAKKNSSYQARIVAPLFKNKHLHKHGKESNLIGLFVPNIVGIGPVLRSINNVLTPAIMSKSEPDIIHETYYSLDRFRSLHSKRVLTVHDMIHELFPKNFSPRDRTTILKCEAIKRADHIICISKNTQKDLIQILGVDKKKISVIYHGISVLKSELILNAINHTPFILYVGARERNYKNFSRFVKAFAKSKDLIRNFKIIAFGGGDFTVEESNIFRKMNLTDDNIVNVNGSDECLASLYNTASLFVYPSLYEGFGIPPLEAMSYGCPVACSNASSIPEVVGDAAFFFDPYSSSSIMETMENALYNDRERNAIIGKGYRRVKKFSWDKCVGETLEVYKRLIN